MITLEEYIDLSGDILEKHFPKGKCKERGSALIFNAELAMYLLDKGAIKKESETNG